MMINTHMRAKMASAAALIGATMLFGSAATASPVDHFRQGRTSLRVACAESDGKFNSNRQGYGCNVNWDDGSQTFIECTNDESCWMVYVPPA
jgi:hypothetical protein